MSSQAWNRRLLSAAASACLTALSAGVPAASGQQPAAVGTPPDVQVPAPQAAAPRTYPARAVADFNRAIDLARSGKVTDAELEFGQLSVAYPELAGPQINIGLLRRKAGNLEAAEHALRLATEKNPLSAIAWTELGVTLRMLGRFNDALSAQQRAVAADPDSAAAHRNLAVLLDLYFDDPVRALPHMERYRELVPDDKQSAGWVAELKQRIARLAPKAEAQT
jgi:tetratricopeptide (TPR) repeat protein